MRFITWLATNAITLAITLWLLPGLWIDGPTSGWDEVEQKVVPLLVVALVLGTVNYLVKPILTILSIPFIIITLGLFLLIVNAAMLGLTSWFYSTFLESVTDAGFHVDGFWSAVWGGLVLAIIGAIVRRIMEPKQ